MKSIIIIILLALSFLLYKENQKLKNELIETNEISQSIDSINDIQYLDIVLEKPVKDSEVTSPIFLKGKAKGSWFFEANFPVDIVNWDGLIIGQGFVSALGDWMTEDLVDFEGEISFSLPEDSFSNKGTLILKKANPSGEAFNDGYLEVPIFLK